MGRRTSRLVIVPRYNEWITEHTARRMKSLDKLLDAKVSTPELGCGAGRPVAERRLTVSITGSHLSATQINLAEEMLGEDRVTA